MVHRNFTNSVARMFIFKPVTKDKTKGSTFCSADGPNKAECRVYLVTSASFLLILLITVIIAVLYIHRRRRESESESLHVSRSSRARRPVERTPMTVDTRAARPRARPAAPPEDTATGRRRKK